MMRPISARERRLVAVLILIAAIAAVHFLVIAPIARGFEARAERREQLALQYTHNLRTIAAIPRLRRQAEQQRAAIANFKIDVRNVEEGREQLKARLARTIGDVGGGYHNGNDAESRPGWASARASATLTPSQMTMLLARLQNEPPWLIIENLSVGSNDTPLTGQTSALEVEIEASIPISIAAVR